MLQHLSLKSKHGIKQFSIHFLIYYKDMKIKFLAIPYLIKNETLKDIFRIMKISFIFLFVFSFQLMAISTKAQDAIIELKNNSITVGQLISEIEKQTDYLVVYSNREIDTNQKVNLPNTSDKVSTYLQEAFEGTDIAYEFENNYIVLLKRTNQNASTVDNMIRATQQTQQKERTIKGKVTDIAGNPLPGVTILIKGTNKGTVTDSEGLFSLDIPVNAQTLQVSFIGMKTQEIPIGERTTFNVILEEEAIGLEEVVAVGYGTKKKINLTGSVAMAPGAGIVKSPAINVSQSLAGRVAGAIVNNRSGEPGADNTTIFIRGLSTLGDNTPLIVVDGIAGRETLDRINPNDIESITVLKDASAAIYGARAANGVILVTTKRGKEGKPQITFSVDGGFQSPTRVLEMCDAPTFAQITNEVSIFDGSGATYSEEEIQMFRDGTNPVLYPNTDWFHEIIKPLSLQQKYNLSVTGGTKVAKYFISVGADMQDGIYRNGATKFSQLNIRANTDVNVTDHFKIGFDLAPRIQWKNYSPFSSGDYGIFYITKNMKPTTAARYPNGLLGPGLNPVVLVSDIAGYNKSTLTRLNSTLTAQWDLSTVVQGLSLEGHVAYDITSTFTKKWAKPWEYWQYNRTTEEYEERISTYFSFPNLYEYYNPTHSLTLNGMINYQRNFNNMHNVGAMFGIEQNSYRSDYFSAQKDKFPADAIDEFFAGDKDKNYFNINGSAAETARRSYFGRVSYDYKSKYLSEFIFRYDGSENFPKNKRWGFFPGIALGWRISEEGFIKDNTDIIDNLKLRFSYGEQGNDRIDPFQYLTTYVYRTYYQVFDGVAQNCIEPGTIPNKNVTWEVAKTYNLGLDGNFWKGKLEFEVEGFKTNRSNILCQRNASIPTYTGLTKLPMENIGEVNNNGFEIQLSHANKVNNFNYKISGNFLYAKNKVVYMDEPSWGEGHDYMKQEGKPMGALLLYKVIGINKDSTDLTGYPQMAGAKLGDFIFLDTDTNGIINSYDRIRQNQTSIPQIVFGLTFEGQIKNFDFMILLQGQAKASQYVYPQIDPRVGNVEKYAIEDRWTTENPNGSRPRLGSTINNGSPTPSTYYFYDASFLRLKNLEIGYTIPFKKQALGIKNMRLYVGGYNLFTLSKLDFIDPENTSSEAQNYPQVRIVNAGLKVTF